MTDKFDLAVVGLGPAGLAAAYEAAGFNKRVVAFDHSFAGGTCLNGGCVPAKALLASAEMFERNPLADPQSGWQTAQARRAEVVSKMRRGAEFSLSKSSVKCVKARAKIVGEKTLEAVFEDGRKERFFAENIIVCTGAKPRDIPKVRFSEKILCAQKALELETLPRRAAIVGAGAIGCEFAWIWSAYKVQVEIFEIKDRILPFEDADVSSAVKRALLKRGVKIYTDCLVDSVRDCAECGGLKIGYCLNGDPRETSADKLLLCAGVAPDLSAVFSENFMPHTNGAFVKVDANFKTSLENVYAAGDMAGRPMLAHAAQSQARRAVCAMFGFPPTPYDISNVPSCVFTGLGAASVGMSEESAKSAGLRVVLGRAFFVSNAYALAKNSSDGFVKLLFDADSSKLIGAAIASGAAADLISICAVWILRGALRNEILNTIFPHPSYAETLQSAARNAKV